MKGLNLVVGAVLCLLIGFLLGVDIVPNPEIIYENQTVIEYVDAPCKCSTYEITKGISEEECFEKMRTKIVEIDREKDMLKELLK